LFCAGNELFFVALYLMHFEKTPIGEPLMRLADSFVSNVVPYVPSAIASPKTLAIIASAMSHLTWSQLAAIIFFPVCLAKNVINLVQGWKASKILVGLDLAERAEDRAASELKED